MAGVGHTLLRSQGWRHGLQVSEMDCISVPRVNCWVSASGGARDCISVPRVNCWVSASGGARDCISVPRVNCWVSASGGARDCISVPRVNCWVICSGGARDCISVPRVNCWVSACGGAMNGLHTVLLFTTRLGGRYHSLKLAPCMDYCLLLGGVPLHVKTTGVGQ
jgi:hypothetical protein